MLFIVDDVDVDTAFLPFFSLSVPVSRGLTTRVDAGSKFPSFLSSNLEAWSCRVQVSGIEIGCHSCGNESGNGK